MYWIFSDRHCEGKSVWTCCRMANLSKLLNYSCYELGHCFQESCSSASFEMCIVVFIESCKIYGVVYLVRETLLYSWINYLSRQSMKKVVFTHALVRLVIKESWKFKDRFLWDLTEQFDIQVKDSGQKWK